jgi:hypothetical protein
MYTGLGKLSIQSEKWRSGVVMFLNVKFCYEIQHFWVKALRIAGIDAEIVTTNDNVNTVLDVPVNKWIEYDQELPVLFFPKIYSGMQSNEV